MISSLDRAVSSFRCPRCHVGALRGDGAPSCSECGARLAVRDGFVDALGAPPERPSFGQRYFLASSGARVYAAVREGALVRLANRQGFDREVTRLLRDLELTPDARVLDVPCGGGNFTEAVARAAAQGLTLGLDLSESMLALARERLAKAGLTNVVLVRGSALDLPFEDASFDAVSACGGLHLYPDVERAIDESFRVLKPGGRIAGLTFRSQPGLARGLVERAAKRFAGVTSFDFDELGRRFERAGFTDWRWEGSPVAGWFAARRPR